MELKIVPCSLQNQQWKFVSHHNDDVTWHIMNPYTLSENCAALSKIYSTTAPSSYLWWTPDCLPVALQEPVVLGYTVQQRFCFLDEHSWNWL